MEAQDATTIYLLKLWPRLEANKNRIFAGAAVIAIAIAIAWVLAQQHDQKEAAAGEALTKLSESSGASPEAFLKIASDYAGTVAAQRAAVVGAGMFFVAGKYADAQTQFQKYLDDHPDGELSGEATLGVASCLQAQGKTDQAAAAYQRAVDNSADNMTVTMAKLSLAKIQEAQGKYHDAQLNFQEIVRVNQNNSLGQDAMLHLMELKNKMPAATVPSAIPPTPAAK